MIPTFKLTTGISGTVQAGPEATEVFVPLSGHVTKKIVKKNQEVVPGSLVATHPDVAGDCMHSPITGTVTAVTATYVHITAGEVEEVEPVAKVDLASLEGYDLLEALGALGIHTAALKKAATLVINGMNTEPGLSVSEQLLGSEKETVEAGLALAQKIIAPSSTLLVAASGSGHSLAGAQTSEAAPTYPNGLDPLVVKTATGKENPEGVCVLSPLQLWSLGKVATTGMPLTETIVSVGDVNYKVLVGTPVGAILGAAGYTPAEGDTLVVGGPFRGTAIFSASAGVTKEGTGLMVVPNGTFAPTSSAACSNCGECVLACPARLQPNLISRYAEFGLIDNCERNNIDSCFECGLCGYVCVARRPMLQYIRTAKQALEVQRQQLATCAINE